MQPRGLNVWQWRIAFASLLIAFEAMRLTSSSDQSDADAYLSHRHSQMRKRVTMDKLTIAGNFYPFVSMGFLEDNSRRFSLHTRSPLGCASLQEGWFEAVLDRRLMQDDIRGLGEPVTDNVPTTSNFLLTLERTTALGSGGLFSSSKAPLTSTSYPTFTGNMVRMYPVPTPLPGLLVCSFAFLCSAHPIVTVRSPRLACA